jgi:hypothetical protein
MLMLAFALPCVFIYRASFAIFGSAAVVEILSGVGIAICGTFSPMHLRFCAMAPERSPLSTLSAYEAPPSLTRL